MFRRGQIYYKVNIQAMTSVKITFKHNKVPLLLIGISLGFEAYAKLTWSPFQRSFHHNHLEIKFAQNSTNA